MERCSANHELLQLKLQRKFQGSEHSLKRRSFWHWLPNHQSPGDVATFKRVRHFDTYAACRCDKIQLKLAARSYLDLNRSSPLIGVEQRAQK
ncbi:hypothetical protein MPTK1_2g25160 [Marchantia polymorpha subsp. ruderalis]|uniref:Uncharacterized protein n=1 Tax=Marchantia polymorpha TaxID=3197 RepID=A0A2R6W381_MARPO|nr:hypothetical protein MARPO_0168s0017 [Marchantia polymorpha]BBN03649.1 hypothetical protein Mp_2g25160 [Marchantia polymorpha subsp. ruderalis]|eukprot:PTQ28293.1 hypothetical protein MARPO_0168s0017 [Marchantia polymorpha]